MIKLIKFNNAWWKCRFRSAFIDVGQTTALGAIQILVLTRHKIWHRGPVASSRVKRLTG